MIRLKNKCCFGSIEDLYVNYRLSSVKNLKGFRPFTLISHARCQHDFFRQGKQRWPCATENVADNDSDLCKHINIQTLFADMDNHFSSGTYWYRWYILGLFSCIAMMSNISWNTWGPIETSARASFGFSKGTVSLLSDWGAITFIVAVFPSAYILDMLGLRKATILGKLKGDEYFGNTLQFPKHISILYLIWVGWLVGLFLLFFYCSS